MEFNLAAAAVYAIIFLSTLIRATFGFGNALVAMPILAIFLDMQTVTPLVAIIALTIAVFILAGHWRNVHPAGVWRLIVSTMLGMPFGLLLLKASQDTFLKLMLACLVLLFSLGSLVKPRWRGLNSDRWAFGFGFLAGILLSAYNTSGPIVVIYGSLRKWTPAVFRTTLQVYFLPTAAFMVIAHGFGGLLTPKVLGFYIWSLPLVIVAVLLGNRLHARIPVHRYDQSIHILLICVGLFLFVKTILGGV